MNDATDDNRPAVPPNTWLCPNCLGVDAAGCGLCKGKGRVSYSKVDGFWPIADDVWEAMKKEWDNDKGTP